MGVAVGFSSPQIQVSPGADASIEARIHNTGDVVDEFELDILGDAGDWVQVEPTTINLLPGAEAVARVTAKPPRSAQVLAGEVRFGLRVLSHEDTEGSVIEEATVIVEPFTEVVAELVPRTSRGRRTGRHELAVDNLGNHQTMVEIRPSDQDALLDFRLDQSALATEPGTATFVRIQARPKKRFLRGQNKTLPFQVSVLPEAHEPITTAGSMLQEALLPKWLMLACAAVAAGVVALALLWFTLVKPEVQSTAREAVKDETEQLAVEIAAAQQQAESAAADAEAAREAAGGGPGGEPGNSGTGDPGSNGQPGQTTEQPRGPADAAFAPSATDLRITTEAAPAAPGTFRTFTNEPPEGKLVWISDLLLQNPRGDSGILQVRRGEDVLFEVGLDNFRDLDYHFIQPVRFSHDQPIVVAVDCRNPGATACTPSVYFTGQILAEPSSPPPTTPSG